MVIILVCNWFFIFYFLAIRSFPEVFSKGRAKRRMLSTIKPVKILPVNFYLVPHQYERTPKESEQLVHMQAGLGRKTMQMEENTTFDEVSMHDVSLVSFKILFC